MVTFTGLQRHIHFPILTYNCRMASSILVMMCTSFPAAHGGICLSLRDTSEAGQRQVADKQDVCSFVVERDCHVATAQGIRQQVF